MSQSTSPSLAAIETAAPPAAVDSAGHRANPTSPAGERIFQHLIIGNVFLISVLVGFLVCCIIGWVESHQTPFKRFLRFHHWINPQTQFYPTVSQMIETAKLDAQPDQVLVIIGSDSILFGSGQPVRQIWTNHLQELLGPKYKVVVMAYPGAAFADSGAVVAEALLKQNEKVLLVSHLFIGHLNPLDKAAHPHVFWEARARHLLLDDPDREAEVQKAIASFSEPAKKDDAAHKPNADPEQEAKKALAAAAERGRRREMPLGFGLDAALRFNDLWTAVGYRNFFTVWEPLSKDKFYWARKDFPDPERPTPLEARNPPRLYDEHMNLIRQWSMALTRRGADGRWEEDSASRSWTDFEHLSRVAMPAEVRKRTLAVVTYESPFYRRDLTPDETQQQQLGLQGTVRRMNEAGYDCLTVGADFSIEDYFDVIHFAPSGGAKMADTLAPELKKLAKQLGYVSE